MLRILTVILAVVSAGVAAHAQEEEYKFDIGAGVGMSGYLGDVNHSNLFRRPGFVGQLSFRYLIDTRWAIRGLFTAASLSGTTADMDNVLPEGKVYDFKSWVYDLGGRVEFNFFNYGIGESYKNLSRVSPYLSLGLGVTMSNTAGESYVAMSLPMGFGVKYKVKSRVNLSLEFCMTKVFGDHVDSGELSDLYQIKSSFLKNTDWYSTIMLGISYEFGKLCVTCHRID
ncbi:MAG: porin family protein [Muribaculaceae bacterium]|nr:porin family protein [Muribaculaceae bacterium]